MNLGKKRHPIVLACMTFLLVLVLEKTAVIHASTSYITRGEFIKLVCKDIGITAKGTTDQAFINAAMEQGIITKNTFTDYQRQVSKVDAAVVLVNAHEFLYGNKLSNELIQTILEKRITDINKLPEYRRLSFAKAYAYGYIKGSSDGNYTTSRTFKPTQKISKVTALSFIDMLKDESKRSKITEDGQLIRTTNLPKFAKFYPYVLASYPNAFYDWEFQFMKGCETKYKDGKAYYISNYVLGKYKEGYDFAYPSTINDYRKNNLIYTLPDGTMTNLEGKIKYNWTIWENNVMKYLYNVFNVDYRTLEKNKNWYDAVTTTGAPYDDKVYINNYVKKYINAAKRNKTIIECDKIAFDRSGIYEDLYGTYLRVYVHYRINSSLIDEQVLISPLAFTFETYSDYSNVRLGEWRNGYYDVRLGDDGTIIKAVFSDYLRNVNVVEW